MRNPSRLLLVLLALHVPALALAQIVPPPIPPAGVASAGPAAAPAIPTPKAPSATPAVPAAPAVPAVVPTPQIEVLPPEGVASVRGPASAAAAPAAELIQIDLPSAPERAVADLKPAAPKAKSDKKAPVPARKTKPAVADEVVIERAAVADPFGGLVGMPVSDSQLNRFVFPEPVEGIYFPEGAPLPECPKEVTVNDPCRPVFLNGRRMMLLQLRAGAQGPVQMLVHLRSGRMLTLNLAPARGPGAVIRIDGAEDGASDTRLAESRQNASQAPGAMSSSEQDVALLSRFARGDIPSGFEAAKPGKAVAYDLFDVVPMATWSNGATLRAHLMLVRVRGASPVALSPEIFRGPGVRALALDQKTVAPKQPAQLYILEQVEAE